MVFAIIKVWFLALASAIPIGPVGLSIVRFSLGNGTVYGLLAILGAMGADFVYATLACFGTSLLTELLGQHQVGLGLLGGSLLLYLGIFFMRHPPMFTDGGMPLKKVHIATPIISTFFLTLANPTTLLAFVGIFSVVASTEISLFRNFALIVSLVAGSMSWWLFLVTMLHVARKRVSSSILHWANFIAGSLVAGAGVFVLGNAILRIIQSFLYGSVCPW